MARRSQSRRKHDAITVGRHRALSGTPELRAVLPAFAENANDLRHRLDEWAGAAGPAPELVEVMSLAVYEAMANAVERADRDREPGTLRMNAVLANGPGQPGRAAVTVEDDGRWRTPDSEGGLRGRRIPLMEALAGVVDIESTPRGTRVRMSWPLDAFPTEDGRF